MKSRQPLPYNFALSQSLNRLRIYRRINLIGKGRAYGNFRNRMALRANSRRYGERRLISVNAFRNPLRWTRHSVKK
jgi:hypothetical protein